MSPEAWSALFAAVGVVVAIFLQIGEWRRAKFSRGIEIVAALDVRFEGPELRELRRQAAAYLSKPSPNDQAGREAARAIINFFETLGFLHAKGVVDAESAWHFFGSWLLPYHAATKTLRVQISEGDPNVFSEFGKIYSAVEDVEKSRHPSNDTSHIIGPDALERFLLQEAGLEMKSLPSTVPARARI